MKQILPGLYTFTGLTVGRVYAIKDSDGVTLIDASLPPFAKQILRQLAAAGWQPGDVKRILITHAHPDHVGALPELKRITGAEVIASPVECPVIEGKIPVPTPPDTELSPLARRLRSTPVKLAPTPVDREVSEGDTLHEVMGGLQVLATPGHTPGHLSFWQPARRVLFCGDVIMRLPGMRLPFTSFTVDMAENRRSIIRLSGLEPAAICFGHGPPLLRNVAARVKAFSQKVNEGW